jgi:hypothetical protein
MDEKISFIILFLIVAISILVMYQDYKIDDMNLSERWGKTTITGLSMLITLLLIGGEAMGLKSKGTRELIIFLSLGLFIVCISGHTIFQWHQLTKDSGNSDCGYFLPQTDKFKQIYYKIYRIIYLVTLIVIVCLLQFKLQVSERAISEAAKAGKNISNKSFEWYIFLFLAPFILPFFTEVISAIMNMYEEKASRPEALLSAFIFQRKLEDDEDDIWKLIKDGAPALVVYFSLMFIAIDSTISLTNWWSSNNSWTSIYILVPFVILFPLVMRNIFIQECQIELIEASEDTNKFSCILEKYGGFQGLACISLIILLIYHVDSPLLKLLYFIILAMSSWGLGSFYILDEQDEQD